MSDYFAAVDRPDGEVQIVGGPVSDWNQAIDILARREVAQGHPDEHTRVLLDTGSVLFTHRPELERLLATDPLLSAIFKAGRGYERDRDRP